MARPEQVLVIVPAAGMSRRTGTANKLLLPFGHSTVLSSVAAAAIRTGSTVLVVTGHEDEEVRKALTGLEVRVVTNERYLEGMSSSIVAAVEQEPDAAFYAVWPGDMPSLRTDTALRVIGVARPGRIALPTVDDHRGHPVVFSHSFRDDLLLLSGDTGARSILKRYPDAIDEIPVSDPGILLDIDTRDDLRDITGRPS